MEQHQAKLAEARRKILQKIQTYAEARSSSSSSPELIAVSKKQPADAVRALFASGQKIFGENYAQELSEKAEALKDLQIQWIYIGHIQSNKIKKIVQHANEIQTVASFEHAKLIARHAEDFGKVPYPVFLEINAGEEAGKSGVLRSELLPLAKRIAEELPQLRVRGLMAIPPDEFSDAAYSEVPELYKELKKLAGSIGEGKLSLGMSGDLGIAVLAGSDYVRVGTALFGPRL